MPRLIDDLRAKDAKLMKPLFVPPDKYGEWERVARFTRDLLGPSDLPVLLIDNVAEYFYGADQEYWDLVKDFPNLAPPYPSFWAEHKLVTKIHSKQCGDHDLSAIVPNGRIGMLVNAIDPADANGTGIPANAKWILWCELFIDYGRRGITADGPHGSVFLCIDAEGVIIDRPWMQTLADESDAEMMKSFMTWFNPMFLAVSFLHCDNVKVVENEVPKPLAKKYRTRTGVHPTRYKTLVIEPLKQILRSKGRSDSIGLAKAMHICRGHFRDYREGRGLFGKYHKLVWTPSLIRGTKGKGAPPREVQVKV